MTILTDVGQGIKIVAFSGTHSSDYGDYTVTGSTVYDVTAIVNPVGMDEQILKSGIIQIGDMRGYFKPSDVAKLVPGYIFELNNLQYEMVGEPMIFGMGGTTDHIEVILKRYNKP